MSTQNFIPSVWSGLMLNALVEDFIFRNFVNTDYEGEISNFGDTVKINTPGEITIEDDVGDITYQDVESTQQALTIDTKKRFAFKIDDIDATQANVTLMEKFAKSAGQGFARVADQAIASKYTEAGIVVPLDVSSNSNGVQLALSTCTQKLSEAKVPVMDRWMIVTPLVHAKFRLAPEFLSASDLGDEIKRNGRVGRYEGFDIYESLNTAVATQHKCLFSGGDLAISFAQQLVKVEALRLEKGFSDALRGLQVWGMKVVRPATLGVLNVTV